MKFYLILFFSLIFNFGFSQTESNKNSVSLGIFGTSTYFGISYERYISDRICTEIGLGLIGYGVGATYYPFKIKLNKALPYIGIKYTANAIVDGPFRKVTYIPIGVTYFTQSNINLGIDFGPAHIQQISPGFMATPEEIAKHPFVIFSVHGNLKLSIAF